jgi:O-antigen ligase
MKWNREALGLGHAGALVIGAALAMGGIGARAEFWLACAAMPGWALWAAELSARWRADRVGAARLLRWTAPTLALMLSAAVSVANPSYQVTQFFDHAVLRPVPHIDWLPSAAVADGPMRMGMLYGGLYVAGLNLAFCVRSRRALRRLLGVLIGAIALLSVLGVLQRLNGARGPYFGARAAPSEAWFATFLYHNHWTAFALLGVAAALGLAWVYWRDHDARGFLHSPGPMCLLAFTLIAVTPPLSASRSGSVLMISFVAGAGLIAMAKGRRGGAGWARYGAAALGGLCLVGAAAWLGQKQMTLRWEDTLEQLLVSRPTSFADYGRPELYADTWRMFSARPLWGWGLESYGPIFTTFTSFRPGVDGLWNYYLDAHSDWLQCLAEIGAVGTACLLLAAIFPLADPTMPWRRNSGLVVVPLAGCALVAAYACVEFPFANPAVIALWWTLFFTSVRLAQLGAENENGRTPGVAP